MDDLELEARLRSRLHRRFDGAELPSTLVAVTGDVAAAPIRVIPRSLPLAWLAVAVLVVIVLAGLELGGGSGPGGLRTASPTPSLETLSRHYIVLPSGGAGSSKASMSLVSDLLTLRIRALGISTFSSSSGYGVTFDLPGDVDDALVRTVLSATGELSFVPLPRADYASGKHAAVVGQPLPVDEPELFNRDQIASAGVGTTNGLPSSIHVELKPAGAAAVEALTSANIGETLAVLIDGNVAALPTVQAPISGGRLEIQAGDGVNMPALAAIVTSGTLPEGWHSPVVPVVIAESDARALALGAAPSPDAVVYAAGLSTFDTPAGGHIAAWFVDMTGTFPDGSCSSRPQASLGASPCPAVNLGRVILDAVTGEVLDTLF